MLLLWEFAAATVLFCDDWRSIVFCDVLVRDCSLPWDVKGFGVFSAPLKGGRSPESGRFSMVAVLLLTEVKMLWQ